jgi:hypothetical protein
MSAESRSGGCLCGAVRYRVQSATGDVGACHCSICQRISGGINLSFNVPPDAIRIDGAEHVVVYRSSERAERAFCGICGSNLWYRGTRASEAPHDFAVAFGSLDDMTGMVLAKEICIDTKPDAYALAGCHPRKTTAEVMG